jgi:hypothetical protein
MTRIASTCVCLTTVPIPPPPPPASFTHGVARVLNLKPAARVLVAGDRLPMTPTTSAQWIPHRPTPPVDPHATATPSTDVMSTCPRTARVSAAGGCKLAAVTLMRIKTDGSACSPRDNPNPHEAGALAGQAVNLVPTCRAPRPALRYDPPPPSLALYTRWTHAGHTLITSDCAGLCRVLSHQCSTPRDTM